MNGDGLMTRAKLWALLQLTPAQLLERYRIGVRPRLRHLLYVTLETKLPAWVRLKDFPDHLVIGPTNHCNLRCVMCYQSRPDRERANLGFMKMELYQQIIDVACKRISALSLTTDGESLAHPQLPEMIRYARDKGIERITFSTNGMLLDEDRSARLLRSGLYRMRISIDGGTKETYERIRVLGKFDKLVANVQRFWEMKQAAGQHYPIVNIHMVVMKDTMHEVEPFAKRFRAYCDYLSVSGVGTMMGQVPEMAAKALEDEGTELVGRRPCRHVFKTLTISWDGSVRICCNDFFNELMVGKIDPQDVKGSLRRLWYHPQLTALRRQHQRLAFTPGSLCDSCGHTQIWTNRALKELQRRVPEISEVI